MQEKERLSELTDANLKWFKETLEGVLIRVYDDIISAHVCRVCDPRLLALKTGMDIRGQV